VTHRGASRADLRARNVLVVITLAEVRAARERISPVLRPTPVCAAENLSKLAGRTVLLKPEHRQRTGSFKIRGAYNMLSQLPAGVPVVAASAGNHAQGVALAGSLTGHPAVIYMPVNAPLPKVEATRAYGASVVLTGDTVDDAIVAAQAHADERHAVFVPPFDDPAIIAGQATVGLEIAEEVDEVGVVVVSVGGGGLIGGTAAALAHTRPGIRVIGVQAEGAASMVESLKAGHPVSLPAVRTMADGIAVRAPSELTLALVRAYVDEIVTVTEEELSAALLLLLERAKSVVEPAGAAALAAIVSGRVAVPGTAVAVLSGGNVDPLLLIKLIDHGLSAAGRYLQLRVLMADRPGSLATLTQAVAELGLNVLEVEHHREGLALALDEVEVLLTVETRDPHHHAEVVAALRDHGFRVEVRR
jgi:threonine dehydratase